MSLVLSRYRVTDLSIRCGPYYVDSFSIAAENEMACISSKWYFGTLSSDDEATDIMMEECEGELEEGLWLIWQEDRSPSPDFYILTLAESKTSVVHMVILPELLRSESVGYALPDGPVFDCLESLVEFYRLFKDTLPCRLGKNCHGTLPPPSQLKVWNLLQTMGAGA